MNRVWIGCSLAALVVVSLPSAASAHVFIQPYVLPVPFWMYLYACAATLVVSFAIVGYFVSSPITLQTYRTWDILREGSAWQAAWRWIVRGLRAGAVACLVLTITVGLFGPADPRANIGMTMFWVLFLLGFMYVTALVGNLYELINPLKTLVEWAEACGLELSRGPIRYPGGLGYIPAFAFYMALIWIELFALPRPSSL